MSTAPDGLDALVREQREYEWATDEYECPDCHRMWPSAAVRDGCCTWDEA